MVSPSKQQINFPVLLSGYLFTKLKSFISTNQWVNCGVVSVKNMGLKDLVGSNFPFWIGFLPPTILACHIRRKRRWGGRKGPLGLVLVQNEDGGHRGCCNNNKVQDADKVFFLLGPCQRRFWYEGDSKVNVKNRGGYQPPPPLSEVSNQCTYEGGKWTNKSLRIFFSGEDTGGRCPNIIYIFRHIYIIGDKFHL